MIDDLIIRDSKKTDWDIIKSLYQTEWGQKSECYSDKIIEKEQVLVAELEGKAIGFGSYVFLGNCSEINGLVNGALRHARNRDKTYLGGWLLENQEQDGGEIVLEFYDNEFTQNSFKGNRDDMFLCELVVHPDFRKRGIGEQLAKERIDIAKRLGSSAVYVSCQLGRYSISLYQKLGFSSIIKWGPVYGNGSAALEMGKLLR